MSDVTQSQRGKLSNMDLTFVVIVAVVGLVAAAVIVAAVLAILAFPIA